MKQTSSGRSLPISAATMLPCAGCKPGARGVRSRIRARSRRPRRQGRKGGAWPAGTRLRAHARRKVADRTVSAIRREWRRRGVPRRQSRRRARRAAVSALPPATDAMAPTTSLVERLAAAWNCSFVYRTTGSGSPRCDTPLPVRRHMHDSIDLRARTSDQASSSVAGRAAMLVERAASSATARLARAGRMILVDEVRAAASR